MKRIYVLSVWVCLLLGMNSCTKDNFAYSGISKARFDGNMLEYMDAHPYDWNLTAAMIRHAGEDMVKLFEGNDENHKEITFFGITNHSIRRYLLENGLEKVIELDADWCRSILLQHIVDGKLYRKAIPAGKSADYGSVGTGGKIYNTLAGTEVWVYVFVEEKDGVVQNAARPIYINFLKSGNLYQVISGDIEPDDCLVHALDYRFTLGEEE